MADVAVRNVPGLEFGDELQLENASTPHFEFQPHNFANEDDPSTDNKSVPRSETPADTAFARTKREEEAVLNCIEQARAIGSKTLDLNGKHLLAVPDELMQMEELEVDHS
jgi:hypothetical protein